MYICIYIYISYTTCVVKEANFDLLRFFFYNNFIASTHS